MARRRAAIPAAEKNTTPRNPVKQVVPVADDGKQTEEIAEATVTKLFVPIHKANTDEKTVTGVVLQPEVVDAHGDIMSAKVIRAAAHGFLASYNQTTRLGLQHKKFEKQFELLESYVTPQELVIKDKIIKEGSWVMTVKILDSKIWQKVKDGKITGFSIGGKAKVKKLAA